MSNPSGIDLSSLPEPIRAKVETALARLTPEQRKQFQEHGSPMLAKLVAHVREGAGNHHSRKPTSSGGSPPPLPSPLTGPKRQVPHGHYNQTIQPGDSRSLRLWLIIGAALMFLVWVWK